MKTRATLPADVHQTDASEHMWTFLDDANDPARVTVGTVIITGKSGGEIVHLEVLGVPDQGIDELRHANLLPA